MQDALISVILPVYNVERYLPKCMDSLFAQTYANLEFLLIDDGSGEACARLCDSYLQKDARVRVFHKPNGGLSDARNYGIARAQGQRQQMRDAAAADIHIFVIAVARVEFLNKVRFRSGIRHIFIRKQIVDVETA